MGLQNFIARRLPAISAVWLNLVDNYIIGTATNAPNQRTALEILYSIVPVNLSFPPGDVRRQVLNAAEKPGWYCYGHAATFVNTTTLTIATDVTAFYLVGMRLLALTNAGVTADMRISTVTFALGVTTIVMANDTGQVLASPILAVSVQATLSATGPGAIVYSNNIGSGAGLMVVNKNTGSAASGRLQVFSLNDTTPANGSGVILAAVPTTYTGAYITGGATSGKRAVLYSGVGTDLELGSGDSARMTFTEDGVLPSRLLTDLTITNGNGGANSTTVRLEGVTDSRVTLVAAGVIRSTYLTTTTEVFVGSSTAIDFSLTVAGGRVLTFRGGNTTGASTPTLSANKPGANAGVLEWVAVRSSAGTVGWMPIFGN